MKLIKEFKEFAIKGNMIDIAIGVIIGAAFNNVVDVLVKNIFFPPISYLTGGIHLADKRILLKQAVIENDVILSEEIAIGYGKMLEAGVDFLIIGLTVFLVVKVMNSIRKKAEDPQNKVETTPKNIELLDKISHLMERQVETLEEIKRANQQR